ncbi:hypothetical protein ACFWP7_23155 [Streptomyces sp. NPDC058470]|uniref:hypothetical protein n=1 Tax=Streptomyces sp. NPDC058470 TaxID=3346515 RepID=UPI00365D23BD
MPASVSSVPSFSASSRRTRLLCGVVAVLAPVLVLSAAATIAGAEPQAVTSAAGDSLIWG